MKIVTDISLTSARRPHRAIGPAWLFAAAQDGAWYDPSDLSTLFQDSAGSTPVTGPGDPVGRMLDKSGNGNHATQAISAARPVLGRHPVSGIRNLLSHSEDFDPATTKWFIAGGGSPAYSLVGGEHRVSWSGGVGNVMQRPAAQPKAGETWTFRIRVKVVSLGGSAPGDFQLAMANGNLVQTEGHAITLADDGAWHDYTTSLTFTAPTGSGAYVHFRHTGTGSPVIAFQEAQLEVGASASAYQKVTIRHDITEAGQRDIHYLAFDGVDDALDAGDVMDFGASDRTAAFGAVVLETSDGAILSKRGPGPLGTVPGWGLRASGQQLLGEYDDGAGGTVAAIGDPGGLATPAVHVAEIAYRSTARSYRNGVLSAVTADLSAYGDSAGVSAFRIGGQGTLYAAMRFYGAILREGLLSAAERETAQGYLAFTS